MTFLVLSVCAASASQFNLAVMAYREAHCYPPIGALSSNPPLAFVLGAVSIALWFGYRAAVRSDRNQTAFVVGVVLLVIQGSWTAVLAFYVWGPAWAGPPHDPCILNVASIAWWAAALILPLAVLMGLHLGGRALSRPREQS